MKQLDIVAAVLVVVGALNWGLVSVARFVLVAALFGMQFGETSALSAAVYGLVGLAGSVPRVVLEARPGALAAAGRVARPLTRLFSIKEHTCSSHSFRQLWPLPR